MSDGNLTINTTIDTPEPVTAPLPRFEDLTQVEAPEPQVEEQEPPDSASRSDALPKFEDLTPVKPTLREQLGVDIDRKRRPYSSGNPDGDLSFLPDDVRATFEKLAGETPDAEDTKRRIALAYFYANETGMDPGFAYDNLDLVNEKFFGKKTAVAEAHDQLARFGRERAEAAERFRAGIRKLYPLSDAGADYLLQLPEAERRLRIMELDNRIVKPTNTGIPDADRKNLEQTYPNFPAGSFEPRPVDWEQTRRNLEQVETKLDLRGTRDKSFLRIGVEALGRLVERSVVNYLAVQDTVRQTHEAQVLDSPLYRGVLGDRAAEAAEHFEDAAQRTFEGMRQYNSDWQIKRAAILRELNRDANTAQKVINAVAVDVLPNIIYFAATSGVLGSTGAIVASAPDQMLATQALIELEHPELPEAERNRVAATSQLVSMAAQMVVMQLGKLAQAKILPVKTLVYAPQGGEAGVVAAQQIGSAAPRVFVNPDAFVPGGREVAGYFTYAVDKSLPAYLKLWGFNVAGGAAVGAVEKLVTNAIEIGAGIRPENQRYEGVKLQAIVRGGWGAVASLRTMCQLRNIPSVRQFRLDAVNGWREVQTPYRRWYDAQQTQANAQRLLAGGDNSPAPRNGGTVPAPPAVPAQPGANPPAAGVPAAAENAPAAPKANVPGNAERAKARIVSGAADMYAAADQMALAGLEQRPPVAKDAPLEERQEAAACDASDVEVMDRELPGDPEEVRERLSEVLADFPGARFEIVDEWSDDQIARISAGGHDRAGRVPAFYDDADGVVYFNASLLRPSQVDEKIVHEIFTHQGIREVLGPERAQAFFRNLYEAFKDDPDMPGVIRKYELADVDDYNDLKTEDMTDAQKSEAGEEFGAKLAEESLKPEAQRAPWYERALFKLRELLRKLFPKLRISRRDLETLLREAAHRLRRQRAEADRGRQGDGEGVRFFAPYRRPGAPNQAEFRGQLRDGHVPAPDGFMQWAKLGGKALYADYEFLWGKHPEYFSSPEEARAAVEFVLFDPEPAKKLGKNLAFVRRDEETGKYWRIEIEPFSRARHNHIRSVHEITEKQYQEAKTGEAPVFASSPAILPSQNRTGDTGETPDRRQGRTVSDFLKHNIPQDGENSSGGIRKSVEEDAPLVEPKPFDPDRDVDYEDPDERAIAVLIPRYGTAAEFDDDEAADYLHGAGFYDVTPQQAHKLVARARETYRKQRTAEIRHNNTRRRDDWLYDNVPLYRHAVDFGGKGFKIRMPKDYAHKDDSGTLLAKPNEPGIDLIELAKYIGRVEERPNEEKEIAEELADFYRNLKRPDLYRKYHDAVKETKEGEREIDRQAKEEFARYLEDSARDLIERGEPVTREALEENRRLAQLLYDWILGKPLKGKISNADIDDINAALQNQGGNPRLVARISRAIREDLKEEYTEKMRDFRDKLRSEIRDAKAMAKEAEKMLREFIPPQYRGRYVDDLVKLANITNAAARQVAFDQLAKRILDQDAHGYELAAKTEEMVKEEIGKLPRDARSAFLKRMAGIVQKITAPDKRTTALEDLFLEIKNAQERHAAAAEATQSTRDKVFNWLPRGARDKFLVRIDKIQKLADPEKRVEAFDELLQDVMKTADDLRKVQYLDKLAVRLRKLSPRVNRSRRLIGTRTVESQDAIAEIARIVKLSPAEVDDEREEMALAQEAALENGDAEGAAAYMAEAKMLDIFGGLTERSGEDAYKAYDQLERIAINGKNELLREIAEWQAGIDAKVDFIVRRVTSGRGVATDQAADDIEHKHLEKLLAKAQNGGWNLLKLEDFLYLISVNGERGDWLENPVGRDYQEMHIHSVNEAARLMDFQKADDDALDKALGTSGAVGRAAALQRFRERRENWGVTRRPASTRQIEYIYVTIDEAREMIAAFDRGRADEETAENAGPPLNAYQVEMLRAKLRDLDRKVKKNETADPGDTNREILNAMDAEDREQRGEQKMIGIPVVTFADTPVAWSNRTGVEVLDEYLNWEQPDVRAKMQMNGWTEDSGIQLRNAVPEELKEYAEHMREELRKIGVELDRVQREVAHTRMTPVKNYFPTVYPTKRKTGSVPALDDENAKYQAVGHFVPGNLRERVAHTMEPKAVDAIAVYHEQMRRMIHYTEWAKPGRDYRAVYLSPKAVDAYNQTFGPGFFPAFKSAMDAVLNGGEVDVKYNAFMQNLLGAETSARMMFNYVSMFKQMMSGFAELHDVPTADFFVSLADAWTHPHEWIKDMIDTPYFQNRFKNGADYFKYIALDSRNRYAVAGRALGKIGKLTHLDSGKLAAAAQMLQCAKYWSSIFTRFGDAAPCIIFGAGVYRYHYNRAIKQRFGAEEAKKIALQRWELSVDSLQQSNFILNQNAWQRGGWGTQMWTRWKTSQIENEQRVLRAAIAKLVYGEDWTEYNTYLDVRIEDGKMRAPTDDEYRKLVKFYKDFPLGETVENKWGEQLTFAPLNRDGIEEYIHHFAVKRKGDKEEYFDEEYLELFKKLKPSLKNPDDRILTVNDEGIPRIVYVKSIPSKNGNHVIVVNVAPDGRLLTWTHMDSRDSYIRKLKEREKAAIEQYGLVDKDGNKLDLSYDEYLARKAGKADARVYLATAWGRPGGDPQMEHSGDEDNIHSGGEKSSEKFYTGAEKMSYTAQMVRGFILNRLTAFLISAVGAAFSLRGYGKLGNEEDVEDKLKDVIFDTALSQLDLFPFWGELAQGTVAAVRAKGDPGMAVYRALDKLMLTQSYANTARKAHRFFTLKDRTKAREAGVDAIISLMQNFGAVGNVFSVPGAFAKRAKQAYRLVNPPPDEKKLRAEERERKKQERELRKRQRKPQKKFSDIYN